MIFIKDNSIDDSEIYNNLETLIIDNIQWGYIS